MAAEVPSDIPLKQKAWFYTAYGTIDALQFGEVDVPPVGDSQVLIKVAAAALNPVDTKRWGGYFKATDSPFPTVPGYDAAGTVVKVGSAVTRFKPGDEVYGDISKDPLHYPKQIGTLAQYTSTEESLLALKPRNLSFQDAAGIPLVLLTANEGFERADFQKGQTVFINGGAGGVGSLAIQIAKKVWGASSVTTTASGPKAAFVRELGADFVINHREQPWEDLPDRFDFVFDTIGEGAKGLRLVKEGGTVLVTTGTVPPPGVRYMVTSDGGKLERLTPFFESGALKPIVDKVFKFSEAKDAYKCLLEGHAVGKVILTVE